MDIQYDPARLWNNYNLYKYMYYISCPGACMHGGIFFNPQLIDPLIEVCVYKCKPCNSHRKTYYSNSQENEVFVYEVFVFVFKSYLTPSLNYYNGFFC